MTETATSAAHRAQQPMLARQRAKEQQQSDASASSSEESQQARRARAYFPLGYREAVTQWWNLAPAQKAEHSVLSLVPYIREATSAPSSRPASSSAAASKAADPFGHRVWRSRLVQLSGKNRALNEYSVTREGADEPPADDTLVMLHGYGAGLGFFYQNFEPLTRTKGWRLYALDMLGMGNSARPPFKVHAKDQAGKIAETESWFVDALEEWRKIRKIEKFTLLGHSLGGYLAVSYALKYPGRLNKLILASPVGIPEDPYAVSAAMPEPEESTLASEFTQDQESIVGNGKPTAPASKPSGPNTGATAPRRPLPGWLVWLWDANVSPFSIVRMSGPLGPRFVSGWTSRRFNHLPTAEGEKLHTYAYSLFRQRGSGEYALPYLLAPGAFARNPIINRIQEVGRQVIRPATPTTPEVRETGIPVVLMYGDKDWMDVEAGYAAKMKLKDEVRRRLLHGTAEEKRKENGSAKVIIVRNAGHHLYLDNPDEFNAAMVKEMAETKAYTERQKNLSQ